MSDSNQKPTTQNGEGTSTAVDTAPAAVPASKWSSTAESPPGDTSPASGALALDKPAEEGTQTERLSSFDIFKTAEDRQIGLGGRTASQAQSDKDTLSRFGFPETEIDFSADFANNDGSPQAPLSVGSRDQGSAKYSSLEQGFLDFGAAPAVMSPDSIPDGLLMKSAGTSSGTDAPSGSAQEKSIRDDKYTVDSMLSYYQENFDKIDTNHDGKIDQTELAERMKNKDVTKDEGIYLAAMFDNMQEWDKIHTPDDPDSHIIYPPVITKESLQSVRDDLKKPQSEEDKFKQEMHKIGQDFSKIDTNHDDCITEKELDEAMQKDGWSPEQKQRLEELKKNFQKVSEASDDLHQTHAGSPPHKLEPIEDKPPSAGKKPAADEANGTEEKTPEENKPGESDKVECTSNEPSSETNSEQKPAPYASIEDINNIVSPEVRLNESLQTDLDTTVEHVNSDHKVEQSGTGSCFVLSPYAALQAQNPEAAQNMIHDNGNGTVTVTFPGDPDHPVTIDKPTAAERAKYSGNENAGIIEKAFAEYVMKQDDPTKFIVHNPDGKPLMPQDLFNKSSGGHTGAALHLLTGNEVTTHQTSNMSEDQLREQLTTATNNGEAIVGDTRQDVAPGAPVPPRHTYKVEFNPETNQVTLTNPNKPDEHNASEPTDLQGRPVDGKADGSFVVSLAEFQTLFGQVYTSKTGS